ncbi:response regulator [Geminocystis sp. CENA526]|uniref:response regulator n=1 Tax=Geminocystis sp. CENA526 TaxID=1355871 RepID=UPI003D6F0F44
MLLKPLEILLVEDSCTDIILMKKMLQKVNHETHLHVVKDGIEAMDFLSKKGEFNNKPRPDIILLDLNLPRKNGKEVLKEIKEDNDFKIIPVIILTTSDDDKDILECYQSHASCYLTKPLDLQDFDRCINAINNFWFQFVRYPLNY